MIANHAHAKFLGHDVEEKREVGVEARSPPDTQSRARISQPLPQRTRFPGGSMKRDFRPASHQFHLCAGFVQQGGKVQGRGPRAEHSYFLPAEKT